MTGYVDGGPLTLCYDEVYRHGDSGLTVKIAPANRHRPVYAYWIAMCSMLAPEKVNVIGANDEDRLQRPFVYVAELHADANKWCVRAPGESLVVVPPAVEKALRERRCVVLVSLSHEGQVNFAGGADALQPSIFDKLAMLADEYDLLPEQLWFVSGNLRTCEEEAAWCQSRSRTRSPFTARDCEISSFGNGLVARESYRHGRGVASVVVPAQRDGSELCLPWQQTKIASVSQPFWALREDDRADGDPAWRFACLNRLFRPHRWWTLVRLFREGLLDVGLVSFPEPRAVHLTEATGGTLSPDLLRLVEGLPLQVDECGTGGFAGYLAQNTRAVTVSPDIVAKECAFEIVNETKYDESLFVSEKSFKALAGRGPAVIIGTPGVLAYLRDIGVHTWPDVIDESYDEIGRDGGPLFTGRERFNAAMDAAIPIIRDAGRAASAARASQPQRIHNLRWLIGADKPWDHLIRDLTRTLADL